jgi:DNA modification methylase
MNCYRCNLWPCECHDGITLIHGDCREVLPHLPPVDLVLTDPPYGTQAVVCCRGDGEQWSIEGDDDTSLRDQALNELNGMPFACFGSWKVARPKGTQYVLVWDKGLHVGAGDLAFPWKATSWEEIYISGGGWSGHRGPGVLRYNAISPNFVHRFHRTEKPLPLMKEIVSKSPSGRILDPFAGSGTTLVAAKQLGRKAIGIEIEERYCQIAANRLRQEVLSFTD